MIQLYTERYYKSLCLSMKRKELVKGKKDEWKKKETESENGSAGSAGAGAGAGGKKKRMEVDKNEIDLKLKEYENSINWKQVFTQLSQSSTSTTNPTSTSTSTELTKLPKKHSHIKGVRILDALAASGLRSLRYYNELNHNLVHSITINDLDPAAIDLARENIGYNKLEHALVADDDNDTFTSTSDDDNDVDVKGDKVEKEKTKIYLENEDATHLMYISRRKPNQHSTTNNKSSTTPIKNKSKLPIKTQYDVIDLDPYGSASPFLDSAIQSISDGGMLAITCTDMKTLGGSQPDTCYARYGSIPINKSSYLQEMAVRILLSNIAKRASNYGRSIKPILSIGMAFYVRVFVEVYSYGPDVKNLSCNIGNVYQSVRCPSFHVIPHGQCAAHNVNIIQPCRSLESGVCVESGGMFKVAGPIWLGPLHDGDVVREAIGRLDHWMDDKGVNGKNGKNSKDKKEAATTTEGDGEGKDSAANDKHEEFKHVKMGKEIHGLLTSVSEELNDVPLYYVLPDLCHTLGCSTPPMKKFKAALINAGYRVSGYHKEPNAVKTDAPNHVVWDILRVWCKEHPPKKNSKKKMKKKNKRMKKNNRGAAATDGANDTNNANNEEVKKGNEDAIMTDANDSEAKEMPISTGEKILAIEATTKVDFTIPDELKGKKRVCRFPMNPEAHWGPKKAASGYKRKPEEDE